MNMDPQTTTYLYILLMVLFAVVFSGIFSMVSRFLGPKKNASTKHSVFESGVSVSARRIGKFPVGYYKVVILFLLFHLALVFLYSWAIQPKNEVGYAFWLFGGFLFSLMLLVGWFYAIQAGLLEWASGATSASEEKGNQ